MIADAINGELYKSIIHHHLTVENIQPVVGYLRHCRIALLQLASMQESLENRGLEVLDKTKFSSSLHLKPFQLCQGSIFVKYGISRKAW